MGAPNEPSLPGQAVLPPSLVATGLQDPVALHNSQQAQQKSTDAQTRTSTTDGRLDDLGHGSDPDFATTDDRFEGMTHEQLYAAVHGDGGLSPANLQTLRKVWFDSYSDLVNVASMTLGMGMSRIFGNGLWKGASADAAQAATEQFTRVTNQVGQVFNSVGNRLDAAAWAAEAVRVAVQPPPASVTDVTPDPDNQVESILPGLINPEHADQVATARERARQEAIQVLNSVYKGSIPPQGSGVPSYADVPNLTGGDDSAPPTGNSPTPQPGGPGTDSPTESGTPTNAPTTPGGNGPEDTNPAGVPTIPAGVEAQNPATNTSPASTTTPAGTNTGPGSPGSTTPGPRIDGGPSGPGTINPRPGGPGSSVPGLPGSGVPGVNSPGAPAGSGTRGGFGTPRSGMGGPMGPMAPGAGAQRRKDDDAEHHAPDYLRRVHSDWTANLEAPVGVVGDDQASGTSIGFDTPSTPVDRASVSPALSAVDRSGNTTQYTDDYPKSRSANTSPASTPEPNSPAPVANPSSTPTAVSDTASRQPGSVDAQNGDQSHDDPSSISEEPQPTALSGTGPTMDDAPETTGNADEAQPVRLSGTGPIMDDDPVTPPGANEPEPVRLSGTGPIMDDPVEGTGR
ncbi:hypothetical protein [Nocardia lijiangensis]|uniref:hypothetical protein n=1 Tax=Nocardia lijiangensis TaxID=299618 RepID=UPI000ACA75DF|nr:hypothetical protein [Nocardia lijiangensis]